MTKQYKGNLDECLAEADAFYDVAKRYVDITNTIPPTSYIYPVIVNLSFCCELYFKALMIRRRKDESFAGGHSLKCLYNELDEADQNGIRNLYKPYQDNYSFENAIAEFDRAFEHWRYAFQNREQDLEITIYELVRFADAVHTHANQTITRS